MRNRGFTLMEVVLAIGLSGAVLGLLTMAIDMYLVRVDASRTQVETAQLARNLLNNIANDLRAARSCSDSSASEAGSGGRGSSDSSFGSSSDSSSASSAVQGIFGTETELRIDRSAVWQWEALARQIDSQDTEFDADLPPDPKAMPQTVRYLLGEGKELLAGQLAAEGVSEEPLATGYAGLYREQLSTAAWLEQNDAAEIPLSSYETENAELIASEVVDIEFAYFDGQELLTEWDSSVEEGLPLGVEIRLTLLKEPLEQVTQRTPQERDELRHEKKNLVEYRRFVKLTDILEPYEAEFPQTGGSPSGSRGFGSGL